jgi:hypothetical protein
MPSWDSSNFQVIQPDVLNEIINNINMNNDENFEREFNSNNLITFNQQYGSNSSSDIDE